MRLLLEELANRLRDVLVDRAVLIGDASQPIAAAAASASRIWAYACFSDEVFPAIDRFRSLVSLVSTADMISRKQVCASASTVMSDA